MMTTKTTKNIYTNLKIRIKKTNVHYYLIFNIVHIQLVVFVVVKILYLSFN
nr:MAG TPA_asm: hypothetical protein [Caudoviricetes sp.]